MDKQSLKQTEKCDQDIVITGFGYVHPFVHDSDFFRTTHPKGNDALPASLDNFQPGPYLWDRRVMKAVSHRDAVGLVAIERLWQQIKGESLETPAFRRGFFVGASPSLVTDYENYREAVQSTVDDHGKARESEFGRFVMDCKPTTLLFGLPNNVLCYGSMRCKAQGPNNNFTSAGVSTMIALSSAMRNFARQRIDFAIVGGYGYPSDTYLRRAQGISEQKTADAACFVALERRSAAIARGLSAYATIAGVEVATSPGLSRQSPSDAAATISEIIQRGCARFELRPSEIDLLYVPGHSSMEEVARNVTQSLNLSDTTIVQIDNQIGDLREASGIMEVISAVQLVKSKQLLNANKLRPAALVLRNGQNGEWTGLFIHLEN